MTWDDRELDGDDVAVGEEVEVGVADAHLAGGDEHLVAPDRRLVELGDLGALWSGKHECLHDSPLLVVAKILQSIALADQGGPVGEPMKAARYHGRLDIRIEDVPTPVPADDELLLSVAAVGICGTDAAEFAHGPTMFPIESAHAVTGHRGPMTPGHEFAGTVVAAGRDVQWVRRGRPRHVRRRRVVRRVRQLHSRADQPVRALLHDRAQPRRRPRRADDRPGQRLRQRRGPPLERRRGGDGPTDVDRRARHAPRAAGGRRSRARHRCRRHRCVPRPRRGAGRRSGHRRRSRRRPAGGGRRARCRAHGADDERCARWRNSSPS